MAAGHAADDVMAELLPRHVARRMGIISDAHAHLVADTLQRQTPTSFRSWKRY